LILEFRLCVLLDLYVPSERRRVNSTALTGCPDLRSIVAVTFTLDAVLDVLKLEDTQSNVLKNRFAL
jgi:hypothetical protein